VKHRAVTLAIVLGLAACDERAVTPPIATPPGPTAPAIAAERVREPPPAPREDGRLPPLAVPERYAVRLTVDPDEARFSGDVKILLLVPAPTPYLVLHGRDLHVTRATATTGSGTTEATVTPRAAHGGQVAEELVLAFAKDLPVGTVTLALAYDAPFSASLGGLYRVKDGGRYYAFTQFEATDARRAIPCFDEPDFKTPWDLTLTVPRGLVAVANTHDVERKDDGRTATVRFATTPPLPSYLVAFAVGDFDVREGARGPVPIRLFATKGKAALGEIALEATRALTDELTTYFGIRYPFDKLDIVAVPDFDAGAMENAGLVTFRDELLLLDPAHASFRSRRSLTKTIAHELAHQWFGDLVTMQWWDDLWLNEGFATWAEAKIADAYRPSFGARLEQTSSIGDVMDLDAMRSARAVRQPVSSTSEAMEAFDGITYDKGSAVLTTIEHWIGEEPFRRGVHAYLEEHAWKGARADDLLRALGTASGKDVSAMAATYLDRPGVPVVAVRRDCSRERGQPRGSKLHASQAPWRPLGDEASSADTPARWTIPLEITSPSFAIALELSREAPEVTLAEPTCPEWTLPNPGGKSYYRYSLDEKGWDALFDAWARLDTGSRLAALQSLWADVRAGSLSPEVVLRSLPTLDRETNRLVVDAEINLLDAFDAALVEERARPAFRRYVRKRMLSHAERTQPRRDGASAASAPAAADEDRALLRRTVVWALGELAADDATLAQAERVAESWLEDPSSVDGDVAQGAVGMGMRRAKEDRVARLRAAAASARTPQDRAIALQALGGFADPATLVRALDVALGDDARTQDVSTIVWSAAYHRDRLAVVMEWVMKNWDRLREKLPDALSATLFGLPGATCTRAERDRASEFFGPRSKLVEGSQRALALALEKASLCVALREWGSARVTASLLGKTLDSRK
jgi:aminopeptidase N